MNHLMSTYLPLPITFARGEGVYLWDTQGKRYLDAISGVAVCSLGHCHPKITAAISEQAATLVHCSNLFQHEHQATLANKLSELTGLETVFFANSGAEANEAALKLARLFGVKKNIASPKVIVMEGAFHGRTLATLSASGNKKIQNGFAPLVEGFIRVPYDDISAIRELTSQSDIVAVMVEPVQGEAGVRLPSADYLQQIRQLCDAQDWLLILDEIQSGMGRTGKWFCYQHTNIKPDIITLAKALANGVPIGACIAGKRAASLFTPGSHGSTFGGNPLATRAALATIQIMTEENILNHAKARGDELLHLLNEKFSAHPKVKQIRGIGLWIGIELHQPASALVAKAAEHGLLINVVQDNTIRLAPPLIVTSDQLKWICDILELVF